MVIPSFPLFFTSVQLRILPLVHDTPLSLLPQNLFGLTDLFLNLAGYIFIGSFSFQPGIIAEFPGTLLDLTLHFMKRSFHLVPDARFHCIPPLGFRFGSWAGMLSRSLWNDPQNNRL